MEPGKRYRKRRAAPEEKGERELGMEGEKLEWKLLQASADGDTHITTVSGGGGGGVVFAPEAQVPSSPPLFLGASLGTLPLERRTDGRGGRRGIGGGGDLASPLSRFFSWAKEGGERKGSRGGGGCSQGKEGGGADGSRNIHENWRSSTACSFRGVVREDEEGRRNPQWLPQCLSLLLSPLLFPPTEP